MEQLNDEHEYNRPVFEFVQPDGSLARLDLSAPGERGDFAFYNTVKDYPENYYFAYHTATKGIFLDLIAYMACGDHPLEELQKVSDRLEQLTSEMSATNQSKNNFSENDLARIVRLVEQDERPQSAEYSGDGYGGNTMTFKFDPDAITISMQRDWDDDETLTYSVVIPSDHVWQFIAGMVWRSYGEVGENYSTRSRVSTIEYNRALEAIRTGLTHGQ